MKYGKSSPLLSPGQIKELLHLLGDSFVRLTRLRKRSALAIHIQFPKIPSILTESIVIQLLSSGELLPPLRRRGYEFKLGGKLADIVASNPKHKELKIEVKATARSGFQALSEKDVNADFLIWLHFGDQFIEWGKKLEITHVEFELLVCPNPASAGLRAGKITLERFISSIRLGRSVHRMRL